ncbi:diguanylate cyclase domain-containing protein [Paenibacillus lutrae]|uniref:Diguanylate cyclase n=1 Tax=Paenibacillus lutrae TaxID=2078573 RepID=A0A7X3FF14_9BACL|nr:diguanylate cyclase [Paenibacillus lutrae]MVO98412.1 diguanylate cyclase [Paenibacillus lutrae]
MSKSERQKDKEILNRTLLTEGNYEYNEEIDLTNCDKEPIHIPGLIQPHGVLLAVSYSSEHPKIVQCSVNTENYLGIPASELLGTPLTDLFGNEQVTAIQEELTRRTYDSSKLHYLTLQIDVNARPVSFYCILHQSEGLLILEMEPASGQNEPDKDYEWIQTFFCRMKEAGDRAEASQIAAEQMKEMLGYDRVMVYEFDEEWNGKVIAEAKEDGLEPFLGHHYPATDIPKQARELYLRNWLRTIVDVNYVPVKIIPTLHPQTGKPLNMSLSTLRSVSPLHIEYLQNMGVGATTTLSLIHENQLWGMITCHHYSPKYISHRIRNLCNFLGFFFSSELYQRQQLDDYQSEIELKTLANRIANIFIGNTSAHRVMEQLQLEGKSLLEVMNATGAAVSYKDKLVVFGHTPAKEEIHSLASWLAEQSEDYEYHTSRLSREYLPARFYKNKASGALYLALSPDLKDYIIWFRPEVVQIVDWAGDPAKAVLKENDGYRLSPRKSFEKWREIVECTSVAWKAKELRTLPDLKSIVLKQTENQMRHAEEQAQQNSRLLKENEKRYLQLMEHSPVAFLTITDNRIQYSNQQGTDLFKAESSEILTGRDISEFMHTDFRSFFQAKMKELTESSIPLYSTEGMMRDLTGTEHLLEITLAQVTYSGQPSFFVIARKKEEEGHEDFAKIRSSLNNMIHTDSLTEMPNRFSFDKHLAEEWKIGLDNESPLSVILMDIDHFEAYNAMYGFQGGDTCLQWISDILMAVGKPYGAMIARYRGDTFSLQLSGSLEKAENLAEQIRLGVLSMQIPQTPSEGGEFLTVTLGVSSGVPEASGGLDSSPDQLLHAAERALQQAKDEGRNRVASVSV